MDKLEDRHIGENKSRQVINKKSTMFHNIVDYPFSN